MERRYGARIEWLPFDLHPEYPAEGVSAERYNFDVNAHHEQLFGEAGLPWTPHERFPNSRAALNVGELARERGCHDDFHYGAMRAFWAEGQDISDPEVLVALSGLDPDEVREVARMHTYQDRIGQLTTAVFEMGANGVPAFAIDDKVLIPGAQPHSLFVKVMDKLGHESVDTTDDAPVGES
jgi:predicted DsbA family dithiol-disulfide isomerase